MQFALIQKQGLTDDPAQVLYTNATDFDSVVIAGVFSFTGTDVTETVYVNLKLRTTNADNTATETFIFANIPLIYGSSIVLPKICLKPAAQLVAFTDAPGAGKSDVTGTVLELAGIYPSSVGG